MSGRKILIKVIGLSLILCVGLVFPVVAQINKSSVNPEVYATVTIPKTYNVPTLDLYQTTWLIEDTLKLQELTIRERAVLKAPEGKYLTLSVNGIGKEIQPGTYKGDVVLSVTDNYLAGSWGGLGPTPRYFHTAVLIDNGKYVRKKSTPALVQGGEVTDKKAEGIYIGSREESFNGIVVDGDSEYTINNVQIDLDGFADNDFEGVGTAVTTLGNSKVTINDSEFNVNGVTRNAVQIGGHSVVTFNNCRIFKTTPASDWVNKFFCWQIGFRGHARAVQLADNGTAYYNNCYIKGIGAWALLSIDNSQDVKMYIKDSTLELDGPGINGYGVFCIGGQDITYDHSTFDVNGYPLIMMGTKAQAKIINGTVIKGRRFGIWACSDTNSVVTIKDSTFQTDKANLCIKGSATTFNIDNTVMKSKDGVIVQMMDSEENGMMQQDYKIPVGVKDVAMPGRDLTTASPIDDVKINIANSNIKGNFFNSTTNIHAEKNSAQGDPGAFMATVHDWGVSKAQKEALNSSIAQAQKEQPTSSPVAGGDGDVTAAMSGGGEKPKDPKGPKNLAINLTKTRIEGIISSAKQAYREGITVIGPENREDLSNVIQTAAEAVNNGVIVSLDKESVWVVTGTSYISSLTIAKGAEVKAPEGKSLTMTVDGVKKTIAAGTYKGKIKLAFN